MSPIRVLEESVAERIAAGEVVERPASVVKELVENSLDAGASAVDIEIRGAGTRLIRVADDGEGIPSAEVALAFQRFATSKIRRLEDLDGVQSYGFRGEALPSIAAVSRVVLTTRTEGPEPAIRAVVTAGVVEELAACGAPRGTVVEVERLFHNTPARLKFLKSAAREGFLIAEAVHRAAMANPAVAFTLTVDGRLAGRWPGSSQRERAAELLGAAGLGDLVHAQEAVPGGRVEAWLGRPERARPNRLGQHLFVNRRPVSSALLRRAVEQGYAQLLPVGRYPAFVLCLEVRSDSVDVNVHPRKLEVRFKEEGALFGAVAKAARTALLASPLVRSAAALSLAAGRPIWGTALGDDSRGGGQEGSEGALPLWPRSERVAEPGRPGAAYIGGQRLPSLRPLGQALNTYVVAEGPGAIYLVDQHAAHERVLYERLVASRRSGGVPYQLLAVPVTVELPAAQMALLVDRQDSLRLAGLDVEPFGPRTAVLRSVPVLAAATSAEETLHRALGALAVEGEGDGAFERLCIATACHTAIRAGDRLSPEAMERLLTDLEAAEDPFTCFHGRPTVIALPYSQIERWFLRG